MLKSEGGGHSAAVGGECRAGACLFPVAAFAVTRRVGRDVGRSPHVCVEGQRCIRPSAGAFRYEFDPQNFSAQTCSSQHFVGKEMDSGAGLGPLSC